MDVCKFVCRGQVYLPGQGLVWKAPAGTTTGKDQEPGEPQTGRGKQPQKQTNKQIKLIRSKAEKKE